jgi:hypothetical protein
MADNTARAITASGNSEAMQERERRPDDPAERIAFALRELVFSGWGVPFARSAEALAAEAADAGFVLDRIGETPFGRLVIARKPGRRTVRT